VKKEQQHGTSLSNSYPTLKPDESPVQKRDSTYKSDESESMRRLKMKWQAKLIEQKSDYGKLVYENRQIVKERDELEHNLGNLLAEHEETIDDLELREQEVRKKGNSLNKRILTAVYTH
jgi:hypothetical protein